MSDAADLGRLVRTAAYFSARQIVAKVGLTARYRLYDRFPAAAGLGLSGPAGWDPRGVAAARAWLEARHPGAPPARRIELARGAAEGRFTFLNVAREPATGGIDWQAADMPYLWRFHLHYADYVRDLAHGARRGEPGWDAHTLALIEDWIRANPPGRRPGWESYPLSLRVVNWCAGLAWLGTDVDGAGRIAASLAAQGRFLARHLEWHLGGNHLLKNAKALIVLGAVLDCPDAAAWRMQGLRILRAEIRKQVLADGGHYERSPLYHGIVMEDLLDILALGAGHPTLLTAAARTEIETAARAMAAWLARMRHPDGGLALFNDCVVSGDTGPAELLAYAGQVLEPTPAPTGSAAMPESGYFVLERGPGRAIIDCGPVGPDELPAHAHADTLSFELAWAGRRVVVDSGTAGYALDDLRRYVRSTAAHNTVRVDEVEQSEVWSSFRVGRRARPTGARLVEHGGHLTFAGAHDGYAHLGVMHHRHVVAIGDTWIVVDELLGNGRHRFESCLHLHPEIRLEPIHPGWRMSGEWGGLRLQTIGNGTWERIDGWYCPDWGRAFPAPALAVRGAAELPCRFGFLLTPDGVPAEIALSADARGIRLEGTVGGRTIQVHSDRCTSSS